MNTHDSSNQCFAPGRNNPAHQPAKKCWALKMYFTLGILITFTGCTQTGYDGGYSGYGGGYGGYGGGYYGYGGGYYGRGGYSPGGFIIGGVSHGQQYGIHHSIGSGGFGHGGGFGGGGSGHGGGFGGGGFGHGGGGGGGGHGGRGH